MKILLNSFTFMVAVLLIIIGFWQYHRHLVTSFARTALAQDYHVGHNQVKIERVQELGFWRYKLNPFADQSWSVYYSVTTLPYPANLTRMCSIDEPSFRHFGPPITLGSSRPQPAKH